MSESVEEPGLRFSPAARAALDEAVQDLGEEISWRAAAIANRGSSEPTLVSVMDVAAALEQASSIERKLRQRIHLLFAATACYSAVGVVILGIFYGTSGKSLDPLPLLAALLIGTSVPGLSFLLQGRFFGGNEHLLRRTGEATADEMFNFLRLWISLEAATRAVYSSQFGESRASLPVASMLSELVKRRVISELVFHQLQEIRALRNQIAHAAPEHVSRQRLRELSRDGRAILKKLAEVSEPAPGEVN
ncbi:hypothetical protein [Streptomyces sp. NPDC002176]|uniref:hypothetical protein n=1 Tax=Streptomyces sp. NPDC002176 TaxID=3364634 RepID=UPI00384AC16A